MIDLHFIWSRLHCAPTAIFACCLALVASCGDGGASEAAASCEGYRILEGRFTDLGGSIPKSKQEHANWPQLIDDQSKIKAQLNDRFKTSLSGDLSDFVEASLQKGESRHMILGAPASSTATQLRVSVMEHEAPRLEVGYRMETGMIGLQVIGQPFWVGIFPERCQLDFKKQAM